MKKSMIHSILLSLLWLGLAPLTLAQQQDDAAAKQYSAALERYQRGEKDYSKMPDLAILALKMNDKKNAVLIARDYKSNHLDKLADKDYFTDKNLYFLDRFAMLIIEEGSGSRLFKFIYTSPDRADALFGRAGTANFYIRTIITKEEIDSRLWKDKTAVTKDPDWTKIHAAIAKKYNDDYARTLVEEAKPNFYRRIENWTTYVQLMEEKMKKLPPSKDGKTLGGFSNAWHLNANAWDLFLFCKDKEVLKRALAWSDLSLKLAEQPGADFMDTRANLLYKLGRVDEAIVQEQQAIETGIANAKKNGREKGDFYDELTATLQKMKAGQPTWNQ